MVVITRTQKKILDSRISISETDRFANEVVQLIIQLRRSSTNPDRLLNLVSFVMKPQNKRVFDSSPFLKFKFVLYSMCVDFDRRASSKKKVNRKQLFAPFME